MGWLDKIFGGGQQTSAEAKSAVETVEYQGYLIQPEPKDEGGQFRLAAIISKGESQHHFIRSDVIPSREECIHLTILKARRLIDEQGDSIFTSR